MYSEPFGVSLYHDQIVAMERIGEQEGMTGRSEIVQFLLCRVFQNWKNIPEVQESIQAQLSREKIAKARHDAKIQKEKSAAKRK